MNSHQATRTTAVGPRQHLLIVTLMLGTLLPTTDALGQKMRFFPIRTAPLGSPPGTIGSPVTPVFNSELGCWEAQVEAGVEVHLEVQPFGWGDAPGSPTLGAVQATVNSAGYSNGLGGDLVPKGWPESPQDGVFYTRIKCTGNGDWCGSPFDATCGGGANGTCERNPDWVMPPCADDLPCNATPTLDYVWASAAQNDCNVDDGEIKTLGGWILDVPPDAEGTYVIAFDPDPNNSFMISGQGLPIPGLVFTSACITIEQADFNRYLKFGKGAPDVVAYRLEMVSSPYFPDATVSGWVGVPDANDIAGLEPDPVMRTWDEDTVFITGCGITPAATFELHPMIVGGTFLPPITLQTTPQPVDKFWGDIVGIFNGVYWTVAQGVVNVDDVFATIRSFQQADGAPEIPRTDVHPREPNRVVNFNDALFVNFAFQGKTYPFGCPDDPCQDNIANPCP